MFFLSTAKQLTRQSFFVSVACLCAFVLPATSSAETRIVGGSSLTSHAYPWLLKIYVNIDGSTYSCGASLIDSEWVLTAAHCIESSSGSAVSGSAVTVWYGSHIESNMLSASVSNVYMHEDYSSYTQDNDIALLKLSQPLTSVTTISPVEDGSSLNDAGVLATVAGWGTTSEGGSSTTVANEVDVPVVSNTVCNSWESYNGQITDNMLCAGYEEGGKDACQGDSGGPLFVESSGEYRQIGIVSWGRGCARAGYYGVYTDVERYEDWIEDKTSDVSDSSSSFSSSSSSSTTSVSVGESCGNGLIYDCDSECVSSTVVIDWLGDYFCDNGVDSYINLQCATFNYDNGDCPSSGSSASSESSTSVSSSSSSSSSTTTESTSGLSDLSYVSASVEGQVVTVPLDVTYIRIDDNYLVIVDNQLHSIIDDTGESTLNTFIVVEEVDGNYQFELASSPDSVEYTTQVLDGEDSDENTVEVLLSTGWNLVSGPADFSSVDAVVSVYAMDTLGILAQVDTVSDGRGAWVQATTDTSYVMSNSSIETAEDYVDILTGGWNLLGATFDLSAASMLSSSGCSDGCTIMFYNALGLFAPMTSGTIEAGSGFWLQK